MKCEFDFKTQLCWNARMDGQCPAPNDVIEMQHRIDELRALVVQLRAELKQLQLRRA